MNITNFRRAVAFALNKHTLFDECWEGYAHLLDCHIPRQHPASIEEEMTYHYYDEDIMKGLEHLADAGFADSDHDGWLEGPSLDGPGTIELDPIRVQYAPGRIELAAPIYHALLNLGIPAELSQTPFQEYEHQLHYHCDYDMVFYGINWNTIDLDWYVREYLSENIHIPFLNTENWINETWDSLAEVVLHSTDLDEIIQTVKQMEHICVYECPAIIMY
jgi:ABC-type transport system substrate-binding protein